MDNADNDGNDVSNSGDALSNDTATAVEADQSLADELPRNHGKLILEQNRPYAIRQILDC